MYVIGDVNSGILKWKGLRIEARGSAQKKHLERLDLNQLNQSNIN